MAILQQPQQPYNLFGPQMMEHQGKKAPQQTLPPTPAQQAAQQIANGNMSQIQQQAQQAEQRAMQTQAIPVTPNNGTPYQPQKHPKPITSTEELAAAMGYTSPEEENRLRKASVMNQRILAVGDALRHIGNIANTVGYAPSQQFNNPAMEEYARYEKSKAIRDAANARYYTYQQQKAAQDAAQRKWEQQFGLQAANIASQDAYRQQQARVAAERAANQKAYQEGNLALGRERNENTKAYRNEQIKLGRQKVGIAGQNARNMENYRQWKMKNAGSGNGAAPLDTPKGQIRPNARNYSNQLLQMFDYAKSKGYVNESDVAKRLRELGFGKDQSDNVKRQMVMDLLRSNQDMGDYASSRLGWSYGASSGGSLDLGLEDDEDEMDLGLE